MTGANAANNDLIGEVDCKDLSAFEAMLRKLRQYEEKIPFQLNSAIPTKSFTTEADNACKEIEKQLSKLREQRMQLINRCITENEKALKEPNAGSDFLGSRSRLRMMSGEKQIEEIIIDQTDRTVKARCTKEALKY